MRWLRGGGRVIVVPRARASDFRAESGSAVEQTQQTDPRRPRAHERFLLSLRQALETCLDALRETPVSEAALEQELERPASTQELRSASGAVRLDAPCDVGRDAGVDRVTARAHQIDGPVAHRTPESAVRAPTMPDIRRATLHQLESDVTRWLG